MKKLVTLLLCMVMVLSLLAACGGSSTNSGSGEKTLTIGVRANANCSDFKDNAYTKWLEETTGYTLSFVEFPTDEAQAAQMISTMALDNDLPDIIWDIELSDELIRNYGQSGYFVDLQDYYADKEGASKTFWEQFEKLSEEDQFNNWKRLVQEDGAIYAVPTLQYSLIDPMRYQPWINKNLLAQSGMEAPTDPESLYQYLKKLKEMGVTMPIIGQDNNGGLGGAVMDWIINMFTYHDSRTNFVLDANGNLSLSATTDGYRDALIYMNKLVSEGLLPVSCWTANASEVKSYIGLQNQVGIFLGHLSVHVPGGSVLYDFEPLDCFGNVIWNEQAHHTEVFITNKCQNVTGAFEFLMTMMSEESAIRQRYGEQGINWDYVEEEGLTSLYGVPAEIQVYEDPWNTPNSVIWGTIAGTILIYAEGENQLVDEENITMFNKTKAEMMKVQYENQAAKKNAQDSSMIPGIVFYSVEEDEYIKTIRNDCQKKIKDFRAKCIKGELDPSDPAVWANYLQELTTLQSGRWLEIAQGAYDRDYAN